MKTHLKPIVRTSNILLQEIAGETLVYDLARNKAFCLNESSSLIWKLCDGTRSVAEIAEQVSRKMSSVITEDFVWLAIQQFKNDNLLEDNDFEIPVFGGMSRREVIRRVGLASAIALPLISAMVVPSTVSAQASCIPESAACTPVYGTPCCPTLVCRSITMYAPQTCEQPLIIN
ncbi:MAG: PqqD family protein [Pyrinomonadaceae bacterium]